MELSLPKLSAADFGATRDYLHNVAKVLGKLQQAFVPPEAHDWHYGLLVVEVGLATREFEVAGEAVQAVMDMQMGVVRVGGTQWSLEEYGAAAILDNLKVWLLGRGENRLVAMPEYGLHGSFDLAQSKSLGTAFWQLAEYCQHITASLQPGLVSPLLVYPHHFDLSLVWFPRNDERQASLGFSTGDETIPEPYMYLTAYPEPPTFKKLSLPPEAHWQADGFSGAVLLYSALQSNSDPMQLLNNYAHNTLIAVAPLFN